MGEKVPGMTDALSRAESKLDSAILKVEELSRMVNSNDPSFRQVIASDDRNRNYILAALVCGAFCLATLLICLAIWPAGR